MRQLKSLTLHDWRQFKSLDLDFDAPVTFLTGANASGKTTVLRTLSKLLGFAVEFPSTPDIFGSEELYFPDHLWQDDKLDNDIRTRVIGELCINRDKQKTIIDVQFSYRVDKPDYALTIQPPYTQEVVGLYLPATRPGVIRNLTETLPSRFPGYKSLKENIVTSLLQFDRKGTITSHPHASFKATLIQMNWNSSPNVADHAEFESAIKIFNELLREFLPSEIGFKGLRFFSNEVTLVCHEYKSFSIDAISGGMANLVNLIWQLFICLRIQENCLVLIDEPENHLHPKLQRTLFPKLVKAFPNFQFVAATHSPVILGSMQDANIYALKFNDEGLVESHKVERLKSPATADDILQEVLGLDVLEPEWVANRIETIVKEFETKELTLDNLRELKSKMTDLGLGESFPEALTEIDKMKEH